MPKNLRKAARILHNLHTFAPWVATLSKAREFMEIAGFGDTQNRPCNGAANCVQVWHDDDTRRYHLNLVSKGIENFAVLKEISTHYYALLRIRRFQKKRGVILTFMVLCCATL